MADHYFSEDPASEFRPRRFTARLRGIDTPLVSAPGVFSHGRLDRGTELLIQGMEVKATDRVLDLGCGYGAIAVAAARLAAAGHVIAADINPRALELTLLSAFANGLRNIGVVQSDGLAAFGKDAFDVIACNPPIRAGWRAVFPMIDRAPDVLRPNGRLYMVTRTRQGADTLARRMAAAFGHCEIVRRGSGYKVFRAVRT